MIKEMIIEHDGVEFRVELYELEYEYETKVKYQAFHTKSDAALSELEDSRSLAILRAIKTINENRDRL